MDWISVKDRLPDGPERVLVNTKSCGRVVAGLTGYYSGDVFIPRCWGCINDIDFKFDDVTHWMPLPTPPYE